MWSPMGPRVQWDMSIVGKVKVVKKVRSNSDKYRFGVPFKVLTKQVGLYLHTPGYRTHSWLIHTPG